MEKMTYSSVKNIVIEKVKKNLFIRPWDKDEVEIKYSQGDNTDIDHGGDHLEIRSEKSLLISVPEGVMLSIETVGGNCVLYGRLGVLNIEKIGGNLEVNDAEVLNVNYVGGNCAFGPITSVISIERVGGNLHVQNANGSFKVEKVGGNLSANGALSDFSCSVGGNAKLNCTEVSGSAVYIRAGGNIKMKVQQGANFDLVTKSGGFSNIKLGTLDVKGVTKRIEERIGLGGSLLTLKAGGNVKISDIESVELPGFEAKPFDQEAWETLEKRVENNDMVDFAFNFSNIFNLEKDINEEVQEKIKYAEERIKAAREKMEQKYNIYPGGASPSASYEFDLQSKETPVKNTVSDEERMMILQMLQEKKISAEEADRLLTVLEQS